MTKFLLTTSLFDRDFTSVISHEIKDGSNGFLVCYDLNNCISTLGSEVDGYDEVLDIYLLESIHHLGKYHQKYFEGEQEIVSYGLRKYISESSLKHPVDLNGDLGISRDFWPRLLDYARILRKDVMTAGVWEHYQDVELPFSLALHTLTSNGVTLDPVTLQTIREKTESAHQKILYALDVNNVSGGQIKDLNDWVRGYGFGEFFPAGRDEISIKDLSLLEDQHQVFKIFVRLDKLKRVNSFLNSIGDKKSIRPFYKTMGAVTSRCTSTNPNIMGVPKIFRPVVVPSRPDFGIVECDYSQMEVGVAAALAEDQNLIEDFNTTDVYEKAGELLFGKSGDGSRSKAKIIFLGIQYGLSRKTIARRLEISEKEAARILASLYGRYGNLKKYLASLERAGKENGYVENISGLRRYRRYPERVPNYWERNWFKNFPIQSSAASVFKRAIIKMYQELKHEPFHLLVPLYDSVVFECTLNRIKEITKVVEGCMITSMREYFPKLKPKVSVNDFDPSCWNSEGRGSSVENFLDNPLFNIDIREKPSSNVDWSNYL